MSKQRLPLSPEVRAKINKLAWYFAAMEGHSYPDGHDFSRSTSKEPGAKAWNYALLAFEYYDGYEDLE